jgi:hypothetical protein
MNSSKIDSSKKILSIGLVLLSVIYSSNLEAMIHFENQTGLSNNNLFFIIELPNRKQKKHDFREFINLQELGFPKTLTIKIGTSSIKKMAEIIDPVTQVTYIIKLDEDKKKGTKKLKLWAKPKK